MLDDQTVSTLLLLIITVSFVIILKRVGRSKQTKNQTMNTSCEQKLEHCCDNNNPISTNVDAVDSLWMCANCGKGEENSGDLKACNACKMVKYCNRDCQIAHRSQHKKACKKRVAELHEEALFKEVEPEECPICLLPLPLDPSQICFKSCCGKIICNGCIYAMLVSEGKQMCPFCRTLKVDLAQDFKNTQKLVKKGNANAMHALAAFYSRGMIVPRNMIKANELQLKAGELGCADAYFNLSNSYEDGTGVERSLKKAKYYSELGAINGCISARQNIGRLEGQAGNHHRSFKHYMIAARGGDDNALDMIKQGFMARFVTKDEYSSTLRAYQTRIGEMKSDQREKAMRDMQQGLLRGD